MEKKTKKLSNKFVDKKCYICEKQAINTEHVPPKNLFPDDKKDIPILVHSCKEHNNDYSKDDEFLRNILTSCTARNEYGNNVFEEKTLKSFKLKPKNKNMLRKILPVLKKDYTGRYESYVSFEIDIQRLNKSFEKIAKGLFYHIYRQSFMGFINSIVYGSVFYTIQKKEKFEEAEKKEKNIIEKMDFVNLNKNGNYPEIFYYKINKIDNNIYICMCFYEKIKVYIQMLLAF